MSQNVLFIRHLNFNKGIPLQRNYSVKSVIVASKNLCSFAARPFAHYFQSKV